MIKDYTVIETIEKEVTVGIYFDMLFANEE